MTFQPLVPFSGVAGLRYIERTQEVQQKVFSSSAQFSREIEHFKENISSATTATTLVDDYRLLKVSLGAFGLQDDIGKKYFIKKILEEGTEDRDAFANRLVDPRYKKIASEFGYGDLLGSKVGQSDFAEKIVKQYELEQFEVAVGEVDNSVRLAMNFKRKIGELASNDLPIDTAWYQIMGNTPLRKVFETAFGLPVSVGALDVERQLDIFKEKATQILGDDSIRSLEDPERVSDFLNTFLAREQLTGGPTASTPGYSALTLLQNSNLGSVSVANLLISNL